MSSFLNVMVTATTFTVAALMIWIYSNLNESQDAGGETTDGDGSRVDTVEDMSDEGPDNVAHVANTVRRHSLDAPSSSDSPDAPRLRAKIFRASNTGSVADDEWSQSSDTSSHQPLSTMTSAPWMSLSQQSPIEVSNPSVTTLWGNVKAEYARSVPANILQNRQALWRTVRQKPTRNQTHTEPEFMDVNESPPTSSFRQASPPTFLPTPPPSSCGRNPGFLTELDRDHGWLKNEDPNPSASGQGDKGLCPNTSTPSTHTRTQTRSTRNRLEDCQRLHQAEPRTFQCDAPDLFRRQFS